MSKTFIIAILVLVLFSCNEKPLEKIKAPQKPDTKAFIGYWENKGPQRETLGIALQIEADKKFYYWFYDLKSEYDAKRYPLQGTYTIEADVLSLTVKDANNKIYSLQWNLLEEKAKKILVSSGELEKWLKNKEGHPLYKSKTSGVRELIEDKYRSTNEFNKLNKNFSRQEKKFIKKNKGFDDN